MLLDKYLPRIEFDSYEDFKENYRVNIPDDFNFGFDIVDEWAKQEPEKKALVWCNDHGEEKTFTCRTRPQTIFRVWASGKAQWSCSSCAAAGNTGYALWHCTKSAPF